MDSSKYDKGLESAQRSLDKYMDKNMNLGSVMKGVAGTIAKFAGAVGVAMGAQEAFDRIIHGSQTTSDEYDRIMRSVNTTIDNFFTAISTGDFSAFNMGISAMIEKAREANDALDALGNATISYGYFNAKNQADFAEQIAILRDSNATEEQKEAAKEAAQKIMDAQKEMTEVFSDKTQKAAARLVVEGNTLDWSQITRKQIDDVMMLDISNAGDKEKEELAKKYKEYVQKYNEAIERNTEIIYTTTTMGTTSAKTVDYKAVSKEMASVNGEYLDAIAYNEILVKKSDDWLKNLMSLYATADNADRTLASMQKTYNRALGSKSGSGGNKTKLPKLPNIPGYYEVEEKIKATVFADSMDQSLLDAIRERKQLPIVKLPIETEEVKDEEDSDSVLSALQGKLQLYDIAQNKIEEYRSLLAFANDDENVLLENQIKMWEEIANGIDKTAKKTKEIDDMTSAIGSLGSILGSVGSMAGQAGDEVAQGLFSSMGDIAEMIIQLQALATAQGVTSAASLPFPYNLAAIATVMATIASVFSNLNFAEGGIVGGTNYQDGITARVSSGEMFINEADQKRLYDSIHSGNLGGGGGGRSIVTGEQIVLAVNNYGKRTGKGVILKG